MDEIRESFCEQDTEKWAYALAALAKPGDIYCLDGDLGAGKTVFAKGFAKGLGIREPVTSPTFTLVHVYESGRLPLYHFDVYRIGDPGEMDAIGFDEYLYGNGVCLIEWSERVEELLPETAKHIWIEKVPQKGFDYRRMTLI